jgi:hypothetical protein
VSLTEAGTLERLPAENPLDFHRDLTDCLLGGSAEGRLVMGGSKGIASFFTRLGKSHPAGRIRILNEDNSPAFEDLAVFCYVS